MRIVELPGLPAKGDVSDWIAAGGTKEELKRLAEASPIWTPTAQPWPEIVSFDTVSLPEFPTHALPDVLREWVEAESHATQTPADLAGLLALAVCSVDDRPARGGGAAPRLGEPVNLYVAVLLEPGNRKSAVFADAMKPLRELEAELIEAARPKRRPRTIRPTADGDAAAEDWKRWRPRKATPKRDTKPASWRRNWRASRAGFAPVDRR